MNTLTTLPISYYIPCSVAHYTSKTIEHVGVQLSIFGLFDMGIPTFIFGRFIRVIKNMACNGDNFMQAVIGTKRELEQDIVSLISTSACAINRHLAMKNLKAIEDKRFPRSQDFHKEIENGNQKILLNQQKAQTQKLSNKKLKAIKMNIQSAEASLKDMKIEILRDGTIFSTIFGNINLFDKLVISNPYQKIKLFHNKKSLKPIANNTENTLDLNISMQEILKSITKFEQNYQTQAFYKEHNQKYGLMIAEYHNQTFFC